MKSDHTKYAEEVIRNMYAKTPEVFDSPDNSAWFVTYLTRWLGMNIQRTSFIDYRLKKLPYETFRRTIQQLISDGEIQISEENSKARGRKEEVVHEEKKVESKPTYEFDEKRGVYIEK